MPRNQVELRHFRAFAIVAEERNFSRAAQRLHVAQPALSRTIQQLEAELGCVLLKRLPRGVELTPAGAALLDHIRHILAGIDAACAHVRKVASGVLGAIRIGMNDVALKMPAVPETINAHRKTYPDVELQMSLVTSPEQLEALRKGTQDIGFLNAEPDENRDLIFEMLEDYTLVLGMPRNHRLAKRRTIRLRDLANENFIWTSRQKYPWIHQALLARCAANGFAPRIVQEVDSSEAELNLLNTGMGVAFVHSTQLERRQKHVVLKPLQDLDLHWPLYVAWRRNDESALVKNFAELLLARVKRMRPR